MGVVWHGLEGEDRDVEGQSALLMPIYVWHA